MIIDAIEIGTTEKKWAERTTRIYRMCRKLMAEIGTDEWEWSPEAGVPSIRDHACSILRNSEAFLLRLTGETVEKQRTKSPALTARFVADRLGEIDAAVRRSLAAENTDDLMRRGDPSHAAEIDELCFTHVAGVLQSTAYLQSLRRLIDPTRVPIIL